MKRHAATWLAAILLMLLAFGISSAQSTAQVTPSAGPPTTRFTFSASGFVPREPVNYWVTDPRGVVLGWPGYEVEADETGAATWLWSLPHRAEPGTWLMVGRGRNSGIVRSVALTAELADDPTQAPQPMAAAAPPQGDVGSHISFFARDFDGDERVGFWANAPDGTLYGSRDYRIDAEDGRAEWVWQVPADAPPGQWTMVARGDQSSRQRVIPFVVR